MGPERGARGGGLCWWRGALSIRRSCEIVADHYAGLAAILAVGGVQRDLKPGNVPLERGDLNSPSRILIFDKPTRGADEETKLCAHSFRTV
ncbi:MAG TPA: hypothetical protein ENK31_04390 [Nannocystis exedens]|nr:hypothetical protein [Nannocystis exedens]